MSVRKHLNQHPAAAALVVFGLFGAAAAVLALWANAQRPVPDHATRAYYSTTDGNTYFADDITRIYPFDHNGKPAYRAYVYRCGNGQPFVSYLARYTDAARARLTELAGAAGAGPAGSDAAAEAGQLRSTAIEVRRPGDTEWVALFSPAGEEISRHPPCPDGGRAVPVEAPQVGEAASAGAADHAGASAPVAPSTAPAGGTPATAPATGPSAG
jgi:hypothetical protein